MGDSDFKFILILAIIFVFYGAFTLLYTNSELSTSGLETTESQQTGVIGLISYTLGFMNPFSDGFNSEFAIINIFIFSILSFGVVVVGARFLRGV